MIVEKPTQEQAQLFRLWSLKHKFSIGDVIKLTFGFESTSNMTLKEGGYPIGQGLLDWGSNLIELLDVARLYREDGADFIPDYLDIPKRDDGRLLNALDVTCDNNHDYHFSRHALKVFFLKLDMRPAFLYPETWTDKAKPAVTPTPTPTIQQPEQYTTPLIQLMLGVAQAEWGDVDPLGAVTPTNARIEMVLKTKAEERGFTKPLSDKIATAMATIMRHPDTPK